MIFTPPPNSIKLSDFEYITDEAKFLESHQRALEQYKDDPRNLRPFKERMDKYEKVKKLKSISA